jgi:hypothetical protein
VTRNLKQSRLLAGALALVVGLTLGAPPAIAAGPAPGPIAAAATAKVEAIPAASLAQVTQTTPATPAAPAAPAVASGTGEKPFLKTTKGVVALVLLGGVLGYTVYAFSNDRVSSPQR